MTKTSFKSHRPRCRDRLLKGTPVAFVLALLLAACQGPGSPDTLAPGKNVEQLMHVADDTRANGDLGTAVDLYRRAAEMGLVNWSTQLASLRGEVAALARELLEKNPVVLHAAKLGFRIAPSLTARFFHPRAAGESARWRVAGAR